MFEELAKPNEPNYTRTSLVVSPRENNRNLPDTRRSKGEHYIATTYSQPSSFLF